EGAVAVIQEKADAAVFGNQHVRPTVVVDVADCHAHAIAGYIQPRASAYVLEGAIRFLMVQLVLGSIWSAVVDEISVEPAVVVVIKEGGAGTHDLRHEMLPWPAGVMEELNAGLFGDVLEPSWWGRLGRRRVRLRGVAAKNDA